MATPAETFAAEAEETLEALEGGLLELEAAPADRALVDTVFRALHTIKGSGEMFGFTALSRFVHHLESAFDRVRAGAATVTPDLIALALESRDQITALLAAGPDGSDEETSAKLANAAPLISRMRALDPAPTDATAAAETLTPGVESPETDVAPTRYEIFFQPEPAALRHGLRVDLLLSELSALGDVDAVCIADDVPPLEELEAADCRLAWRISLTSDAPRSDVEDVFIFVMDGRVEITESAPEATPPPTAEQGEPSAAVPPARPASGEDGAPAKAEKPRKAGAAAAAVAAAATAGSDSVRVQSHRLDALMNQLGELVILQARLHRISNQLGDDGLETTTEEIDRLVTTMRDVTLSIRMLPLSLVFGKFRRVVRDLSAELGKKVELETYGGETEVDKNVIDKLTEPLVHLMRNAIDHGVEAPEERLAQGKPGVATISLHAHQTAGAVRVTLRDNGAGLDTEKIRRKAIAAGLLPPDDASPEEEVQQLIFAPGFSTADTVTSVSGRGVGMDAVRRAIADLRGRVAVRSWPGRGTEVNLHLPLTLAIIEGLMVHVCGEAFIIPLWSVEECVELPAEEVARNSGRSLLRIREDLVPFLRLDRQFGFEQFVVERPRVVIVRADGQRVGLVVDDIVGEHQTVIKPLSPYHREIAGLAGCTILGDGSVALILDGEVLVKHAHRALETAA